MWSRLERCWCSPAAGVRGRRRASPNAKLRAKTRSSRNAPRVRRSLPTSHPPQEAKPPGPPSPNTAPRPAPQTQPRPSVRENGNSEAQKAVPPPPRPHRPRYRRRRPVPMAPMARPPEPRAKRSPRGIFPALVRREEEGLAISVNGIALAPRRPRKGSRLRSPPPTQSSASPTSGAGVTQSFSSRRL